MIRSCISKTSGRKAFRIEVLEARCLLATTPLANDADSLLLLRFDGNSTGESGEVPVAQSATSYVPGLFHQALHLGDAGQLRFPTSNNISAPSGTIEFWIQPDWNGNQSQNHHFVEVGGSFDNGLLIAIDAANNLRVIQWGDDPGTPILEVDVERGVATSGASWNAGEWHHLAATWDGVQHTLMLYLDGALVDSIHNGIEIDAFSGDEITVGSDDGSAPSLATMEEFRVSNRVRTPTEIQQSYLAGRPFVPPRMPVTATNPVQTVRVVVLNFEPTVPSEQNKTLWQLFGWNDPRALAAGFIEDVETVSGGAVDYEVVDWRDLNEFPIFTDGFRYTADQYVQNRRTNSGWVASTADFYAIAKQQGLAELVNNNIVDEIWMFGDHYFSLFGESWMAGPGSFFINGPSFPDFAVDRAVAGYGFSYERGVGEMLHNFAHRTENHLSRMYGSWNIANPSNPWDFFSANVGQTNRPTFGVGTAHYPFNGISDYDYANPSTYPSYADDFIMNFPQHTYVTSPSTRYAWGDLGIGDWQRGYMKWFFGHLPRYDGTSGDGRQNNWFKSMFDFNAYQPNNGLPRDNDGFLGAPPLVASGEAQYEFSVRSYDLQGLDVSSLDNADFLITGPNGFSRLATLQSIGIEQPTTGGGRGRTVRYRVDGPGGNWDDADVGIYTVNLRAGQVRDLSGVFLPGVPLGTFQVNPSPAGLIDVAAMLVTGQATAAATSWDVGGPAAIFDTNASSLYRSANVDPATITLTFDQPQSVNGFRTLVSHASGNPAYRWKVETANSLSDLNAASGSYRLAVPFTGTPSDNYSQVILVPSVTATHFRLTVERLTGDNYVHINEWQLLKNVVPDVSAPTAIAQTLPMPTIHGHASSFAVRFRDDQAIDIRSINFGDIQVTGPHGFAQTAGFYGLDVNANGDARDATYFVSAPGGTWDYTENGTYVVELIGQQVLDLAGRAVIPGTLGSFVVAFPLPESRPAFDMTELNASDWFGAADGATASTFDDTVVKQFGAASVRFETTGGFDTWMRYEPSNGALWDLTAASVFRLNVLADNPSAFGFQTEPVVRFIDADGDAMEFRYYRNDAPFPLWSEAIGQWIAEAIPIKSTDQPATGWRGTPIGSPDWSRMSTVELHADTWDFGFTLWFDRMGFDVPEDINHDGNLDVLDLDELVSAISAGSNPPTLDFTGDSTVNLADLDHWLSYAGEANLGQGRAYLRGDANLDGGVDGSDFNIWNANKFTPTAAWSRGDFNADGVVDGSDFNIWNSNKFTASDNRRRPRFGERRGNLVGLAEDDLFTNPLLSRSVRWKDAEG